MLGRRPLVRNIMFLFSSQGLAYLVPLLTIPYLMRSLGTVGFGVYSLAMAVSGYLQIPMEYGFALSGTREVARNRDDNDALLDLFWSVTWTKIAIGLASVVVLAVVVLVVPSLRAQAGLMALAGLGAAVSAFFPTWLLQGLEKMKDLARLSILTRLLNAGFIFLMVHSPQHLWRLLVWAILINLATTTHAHILAFQGTTWRVVPPRWKTIQEQLHSGLGVFLSQVGFLLYANTNLIMLSIWHSPEVVGAYAVAEKIMRAAAMMTYAISQAIYPVSSRVFAESKARGEEFLRKVVKWTFAPIAVGCVLLFLLAGPLIRLFTGASSEEAVSVLRLFAPLPLSIYLCNLFGSQVLLTLGKDREYFTGTLLAGGLAVALQFAVVPAFGAQGAALCLVVAEIGLLGVYAWFTRRMGIRIAPVVGV